MTDRKFKLTVGLALLYALLLAVSLIDKTVFAGLMGSLVPLYFAANVGQKYLTKDGSASTTASASSTTASQP